MSDARPKLLRMNQLADFLGLSRTTAWRLARRTNFPRARHLGPGSGRVWLAEEIDEWLKTLPVALDG